MNHFRVCCFVVFLLIPLAGYSQPETFTYHQRLIFVEMQVNEAPGMVFLIDTGASASAFDLKTAEKLGLTVVGRSGVEGTAGMINATNVQVKSLSIGNARAKNLVVPAYDLSGLLAPPGTKLAGILGCDFLRSFAVTIDFREKTIEFSKNGAGKSAQAMVPFRPDNGIPRVKGVLNDAVNAELRLDTGASLFETSDVYLNVTEAIWNALTALDTDLKPDRYFTGGGIGGEVKLPVARIKTLSVGGIRVSSPFVIVQPKRGYFARPEAVGFVSNNFLEKFSPVTIDYLKRRLYLTKEN
jgi:predicted aspartyl protease